MKKREKERETRTKPASERASRHEKKKKKAPVRFLLRAERKVTFCACSAQARCVTFSIHSWRATLIKRSPANKRRSSIIPRPPVFSLRARRIPEKFFLPPLRSLSRSGVASSTRAKNDEKIKSQQVCNFAFLLRVHPACPASGSQLFLFLSESAASSGRVLRSESIQASTRESVWVNSFDSRGVFC